MEFQDPFAGAEVETKAETKKEVDSIFEPVKNFADESETVNGFDLSDVFNMAKEKFIETSGGEQLTGTQETVKKTASEVMPDETIVLSANIYVSLLEVAVQQIGEYFSGVSGNYSFNEQLKKQYAEISAIYFRQQNVRLTPGHFFGLLTIALIANSGVKVYRDRQNRLKAESFRKKVERKNQEKNQGEQLSFFPDAEKVESVTRSKFSFTVEDGTMYYKEKPNGGYAKKTEREKVPSELQFFLSDFLEKNNRYPNRKEVNAFLHN